MTGFPFVVVFGSFMFILTQGSILEEFFTDRIRFSSTSPNREVKFMSGNKLSLNSLAFTANMGYGSSFRYATGRISKSAKGVKRVRLIQTYAGYDVFGSNVVAEMNMNEDFTGHMYGQVVKNIYHAIPNPEVCRHTLDNLHTKALQLEHIHANDANVAKRDGRRLVFASPEINKPRLAYKIEYFYRNASDVKYPVYIFDACNGEVLLAYDQLMTFYDRKAATRGDLSHKASTPQSPANKYKATTACDPSCEGEGGNTKSGKVTYNTDPYCLNVKESGTDCTFEGTYVRLIDNEGSTDTDKTESVTITCSDGYKDAVNDAYGVGNDAFFHGELFGQFFKSKFDIELFDYLPRLIVHFDSELENAYADGTDTYYGDGKDFFHPLVSIDIVAHELAHLITARNSDLIYRGMSGGINEAFSDIVGATVTKWFRNDDSHWHIGSAVTKTTDALRYMDDPTKDGISIDSIFSYRPLMGVHQSSGIFNFAFHHMVDTYDIDINDAFKCFYDANVDLWGPFTNFFSGSCNVMQAAYDNGFEYRDVRRAFRQTNLWMLFCFYARLSSPMYVGETREEILVRAGRSPIIKIELDTMESNFTVKAVAENNSQVELSIGIDDEATKVIAKGFNIVKVNDAASPLYVKLMSDAPKDLSVKMSVLK